MMLILKRINEDVRPPDIESFLQPAITGGFLRRSGRIQSVKILMQLHRDADKPEFHALVDVLPDPVARRVAKLLNRKPCKGKPINVAIYMTRTLANDRRQSRYKSLNDRRVNDRRSRSLQIKDVTKEIDRPKAVVDKNPSDTVNWY